jgi:diaminopimelate epimerase
MKTQFFKFHGTGNDFILADNREGTFRADAVVIAALCDRHFGVGADGLILLHHAEGFDFGMSYYNSDGKESTMCGNGGRCITAFASHLGIITGKARFMAMDGEHEGEILSHDGQEFMVRVRLKDALVDASTALGTFVNTGSPHLVRYVADVYKVDVVKEGRKIRYGKKFAEEGINVDFVEIIKETLHVRTYERGVENETLSCGTGVTAAALVTASKFNPPKGFYNVETKGGHLKVSFQQGRSGFADVWLEGSARLVFEGTIEV